MKKVISAAMLFLLLLAPLSAQPAQETSEPETRIIVDHDGDEVEIPARVERLVILQPWPISSMVTFLLGGTDRIVGVPPAAISAAKSGLMGELFPSYLEISSDFTSDGGSVNPEELLALNPDLVITLAGHDKQKQAVRDAGIPAVAISVGKWDFDPVVTYIRWLEILGEIFPEAGNSSFWSRELLALQNEVLFRVGSMDESEKVNLFFLWRDTGKSIITSGKRFWGQGWCNNIGVNNVAEAVPGERANAVVDMEQIYNWDPDMIFISNFTPVTPDDLFHERQPGRSWEPLKAVREGRVYKMPRGLYRTYTPGADTPLALIWMAKRAYPELFADWDMSEKARQFYRQMYHIDLTDDQIERMYNISTLE